MNRCQFAIVHYRPDPSRPTHAAIRLGVLVELISPELHVVAMQARSFLADRELQQLDGIGRNLLAHPFDYLRREVEKVLSVQRDGSVLETLCEQHSLSLFVSPPQSLVLDAATDDDADRITRSLYQKHVVGSAPPNRVDFLGPPPPASVPPWAQSPEVWELPSMMHAS